MNIKHRLSRLELKHSISNSPKYVFKKVTETADEAFARGKLIYPQSDLVVISWISPQKEASPKMGLE